MGSLTYLLEALSAFARGEFMLALENVWKGQFHAPRQADAPEIHAYWLLAASLYGRAWIYYRNLCEREGAFLFAEIPIRQTQRRFAHAPRYLLKALQPHPPKKPVGKPRLVAWSPSDKGVK